MAWTALDQQKFNLNTRVRFLREQRRFHKVNLDRYQDLASKTAADTSLDDLTRTRRADYWQRQAAYPAGEVRFYDGLIALAEIELADLEPPLMAAE